MPTSPGAGSPADEPRRRQPVAGARASAIAVIWLTTALMCVLAPDLVTGSEHERLPIATLTLWVWAGVSSAYVLLGSRHGGSTIGFMTGVIVTWMAVLVVVVASPVLVTGTDPTEIPLAVFVAPVLGAFATGFLALFQTSP